jgi:hypothetical protein
MADESVRAVRPGKLDHTKTGGVVSESLAGPAERGRRWSVKRSISVATALVLVGGGLLLIGSRAAYDQWPWSAYPSTLHVCGRDFIDEGSETRSQIVGSGGHLIQVGSVPGWLTHGELWTTTLGAPLNGTYCHVVMWVRTGPNLFESYALSGGP